MSSQFEKDLVLKRCAIYGTSSFYSGYSFTFSYLKDVILQSIEEGFTTFITTARDGYELDAARFLCVLKKSNPAIHLIIVQPYRNYVRFWKTVPIFNDVCRNADIIKYITDLDDAAALEKTDLWITEKCHRIISATNSPSACIKRLQAIDLSEKDCIKVCAQWSKELSEYIRPEEDNGQIIEPLKPEFPNNLLCELMGIEYSESHTLAGSFPDDVGDNIFYALSRYDERSKKMIYLRYCENMTLKEIGEEYGLSKERVRQLIEKSKRRLKSKFCMAILRGENPSELHSQQLLDTTLVKDSSKIGLSKESNKWKRWTSEEIENIKEDLRNFPILSVAEKYGRQPESVARLIRKNQLMTTEEYYSYVGDFRDRKVSKPAKANERWTEAEEQQLMEMFNSNATLDDIAAAHMRTQGAIVARVARLTNKDRETILNYFCGKK